MTATYMTPVRAWYQPPENADYWIIVDMLDEMRISWRLFVNALPGGRTVIALTNPTLRKYTGVSEWSFDTVTGKRLSAQDIADRKSRADKLNQAHAL